MTGADAGELLVTVPVLGEPDVFTAGQCARDAATALGCHPLDQIRVAAALSEVGRELLAGTGGSVAFRLLEDPPGRRLAITVTTAGPAAAADHWLGSAAARLLDEVRVSDGPDGAVAVTLVQRLAMGDGQHEPEAVQALRLRLAQRAPVTAGQELRRRNQDLLATLDQLHAQQQELVRLNSELDERGVQLEGADDARTRFLRSVSHELRTPVNSVLGLARLLLDPDADPLTEEQRRQVSLIHSSGTDLLGLVSALLDLAKADSGRLEVTVTEVHLAALVESVRDMIAPLVRPGVRLVVEVAGGLPPLRTDEALLRHVLRNLLSNAAKFTESGEILVTAGVEPDQVVLAVRDTGVGISAQDQPRVFEEFYQVRNALQTGNKGTGLGLPLANGLVGQLGGRIELDSEPGRGSTFTVRLPRRPQAMAGDPPAGAPWTA